MVFYVELDILYKTVMICTDFESYINLFEISFELYIPYINIDLNFKNKMLNLIKSRNSCRNLVFVGKIL